MQCEALRFTACLPRRNVVEHVRLRNTGKATQLYYTLTIPTRSELRRSYATTPSPKHPLSNIQEFTKLNPITIFHSQSDDPYYNLAVENHLLKHSDPNSRILFTYVNRPCVVIGRNQNPWLECNIGRISKGRYLSETGTYIGRADIVRRRSGGGTVVHDPGNLNFSFIVPNDANFTRNKHAQIVVDALRAYKVDDAKNAQGALYDSDNLRVNERHDIVVSYKKDHRAYGGSSDTEYKVSGSAYKLTRGRALHHGTLLLMTPNVVANPSTFAQDFRFSEVLSSHAREMGVLDAKGVASVRSPVTTLFLPTVMPFWQKDTIIRGDMQHSLTSRVRDAIAVQFRRVHSDDKVEPIVVGQDPMDEHIPRSIQQDIQELTSNEWRYCQTPSFKFSYEYQPGYTLSFEVKRGIIEQPRVTRIVSAEGGGNATAEVLVAKYWSKLAGEKLHRIFSWKYFIRYDEVCLRNTTTKGLQKKMIEWFPRTNVQSELKVPIADPIEEEVPLSGQSGDHALDGAAVKRRLSQGNAEVEEQGENVVKEQ